MIQENSKKNKNIFISNEISKFRKNEFREKMAREYIFIFLQKKGPYFWKKLKKKCIFGGKKQNFAKNLKILNFVIPSGLVVWP